MAKKPVKKAKPSKPQLTEDQLAKNARVANTEHRKIVEALGTALQHAFAAGHALRACKDTVGHGNWTRWLADNCSEIKERTAQEYMWFAKNEEKIEKAATAYGEGLAYLSMRGAAKLIAVEDEAQDEYEEDTQDVDDTEDTNYEDTATTDTEDDTEDTRPDLSELYEQMPEENQQKLADVIPLKAVVKNRPDREICETLCNNMPVEDLMRLASGLVQFVMGGKDTPKDRLLAYRDEIRAICDAVIPPGEEIQYRKAG